MPSRLSNLFHKLEWVNFKTRKKDPPPKPGTLVPAAFTLPVISTEHFGTEEVAGSNPKIFRVKNTIEMSVDLSPSSWVQEWVFKLPSTKQDELLNHERGHFRLGALLARDFFLDLMQLKLKDYSNRNDAKADFDKLRTERNNNFTKIIDKYDTATTHGTVAVEQANWDAFIEKAFTTTKSPGEMAADGATIKLRIVDVLKAAKVL
jgi:hypothetical protein